MSPRVLAETIQTTEHSTIPSASHPKLFRTPDLQPIPHLQHTIGNRAVQRLIQARRLDAQGRSVLQQKLAAAAAGDACKRDTIHREVNAAHELTDVISQGVSQPLVQRQSSGSSGGGTPVCTIPSGCPQDFCTPFPGGRVAAGLARDAAAPVLLAGIATQVNPRVASLWRQYLFGGASPQDLSSTFGSDFSSSATTATTTDFLVDELKKSVESSPPSFPAGAPIATVDIPSRIPAAISAIGTPGDPNQMDFSVIGEIPGNIAGGIGKDKTTCPIGAKPSPFDDDRTAAGTAMVIKNPDGSMTVIPTISFTVQDTIDLCPGNCGATKEQVATVPMSSFEAAGVSGDVPFTVTFLAPPRVITANPSPTPTPPPAPPVPVGPVSGKVIASALRIREAPNTSSAILGLYPRGTVISILCQTAGEVIEGNGIWDKTDRGFVSDNYVSRTGTGTPPNC